MELRKLKTGFLALVILFLFGCEPIDKPTPTKQKMLGTWEMTDATLISDSSTTVSIKNDVTFLTNSMQLTDDNGMVGTFGPMYTYIVYGGSKWSSIVGKISQAFNYANLEFNTGEWFIDPAGTPDRFTVEAKLKSTAAVGGAAAGTFIDILAGLGVQNDWLTRLTDATIYHKFIDVKVNFLDDNTMVWEFDTRTNGKYNYKDYQGNLTLWQGWDVSKFTKSRFIWSKRVKTLRDVVSGYL